MCRKHRSRVPKSSRANFSVVVLKESSNRFEEIGEILLIGSLKMRQENAI